MAASAVTSAARASSFGPDGLAVFVETDEFEAPEGPHFALEVADLDAALDVLADHGVEASAAKEIDGVCRQSFLRDPTGNLIELNQPL